MPRSTSVASATLDTVVLIVQGRNALPEKIFLVGMVLSKVVNAPDVATAISSRGCANALTDTLETSVSIRLY
eukprot:scaffold7694_cov124-Alexandrium_tamarense.AAC.1